MRGSGGVCWDMTSTCVQGGLPRPLGGYQPNVILEPHSPAPAWSMHHSVVPKQEPEEDLRNDSGLHSGGSDFHSSSSPGSDNSQEYNNARIVQQTTTTTFYCPQTTSASSSSGGDPLSQLQMTFEKNGLLPTATTATLSPKTASEHSGDDEGDGEAEHEEGVRVPAMNSHGKVKTFKCKQCDFVAITKLDFWAHSKAHIKSEKILACPRCPFVTEYKHHLEYHLRNHVGSKPFKCDKCAYTCVNKSMLNSHMKSHSNVYQYRCRDCTYATKYCHSLKLHLRKYRHQPAMVLHPDGTPNPLPIIDVYGTRRGPKQKLALPPPSPPPPPGPCKQQPEVVPSTVQQPATKMPVPVAQLNCNPFASIMNLPFEYPFFPGALLAMQLAAPNAEERPPQPPPPPPPPEATALDLSKPEAPAKHRRKGKAFKLERPPASTEEAMEEEENTTLRTAVSAADCTCRYCGIAFGDVVLYTMHMGYHGYKDPFTCNMCGEQCNDKVAFFLHIARNPHT